MLRRTVRAITRASQAAAERAAAAFLVEGREGATGFPHLCRVPTACRPGRRRVAAKWRQKWGNSARSWDAVIKRQGEDLRRAYEPSSLADVSEIRELLEPLAARRAATRANAAMRRELLEVAKTIAELAPLPAESRELMR